MYLEESGWECSSAQWVAGTQGASLPLPVDPTSPMCAPPLTTTTLPDHPLRKGGGVTPSANQNPQAPGVQPMGWPWPCRGRTQGGRGGAASVGGAHVSGPGRRGGCEAAGVRVPRRGLCTPASPESRCPVPLLPWPVRAGHAPAEKKKRPVPAPKDRHLFDLSASGFSLLNPTTKSLVALGRTGHLLFLKHILWLLGSLPLVNYVISLSGLPCLEVH